MSEQSPISYHTDDSFQTLFDSFVNIDGDCIELQEILNEYQTEQLLNADAGEPKTLTINASLDAIEGYLKQQCNAQNARANVIIKLKDPKTLKSLRFTVADLPSPTTTAPSSRSQSCTPPSRSPSPHISASEEAHIPQCEDSTNLQGTTAIVLRDEMQRSSAGFSSTYELEEAASPTLPSLFNDPSPIPSSAERSPITPKPMDHLSIASNGDKAQLAPVVQRSPSPIELDLDKSANATGARSTPCRQSNTIASQKPSYSLSGEEQDTAGAAGAAKRKHGHHRRQESSENIPAQQQKRRATLELDDIILDKVLLTKIKDLTTGQDSFLTYKMVQHAQSILPTSCVEELAQTIESVNEDSPFEHDGHLSPSKQADLMRQFCTTIRKIEWVEKVTLHSMIEYRVLFVQLYQQYLALQSVVVVKKGQKRVEVAKQRLYSMLYPNIAKVQDNGKMSDEWERFNRCIRRGKQWNTLTTSLGTNILQRMPSSISHSWVEQRLQTKRQLTVWIQIVNLLTYKT